MEEYGWEAMWWKDPELIMKVTMSVLDNDDNDKLDRDELVHVLSALQIPDKADYVFYYYAEDKMSLTDLELEQFIKAFIYDNLIEDEWGTPWWIFLDDDVLFDGLNERLRMFVKSFDQNGDGKTSIVEFLHAIQHGSIDSVVAEFGIDSQWWNIVEAFRIYVRTVHKAAFQEFSGYVSEYYLVEILSKIEISADARWLYQAYA